MSHRPHTKSKIKILNKNSVFHMQNKKDDGDVLSTTLIKSAKRSGQLSLCNRGLGSVPENVWKLDAITLDEYKDIDFNRSDTGSWWTNEPLKILDLSSNSIKEISKDIKLLEHLASIKLHNNCIEQLPSEIGDLKNLTYLNISHNKLVALPNEFYKLTELRNLLMSNNLLETLSPEFGDLVMLTKLDLSHNKLTNLPSGMGYLVRLIELNLSHNKLADLPPDIVNLRDLKKLELNMNELKYLPAMGELRRMIILDANHNNIEELPDFYGCESLRELYLANNCIKEIKEEFCEQLQHINVLNLRDNQIELLPENISLLRHLKRFDLTNNCLNKLPKNLGLLSQLQCLSMEGNKLTSLRQDMLKGDTNRLMKILRDRIQEDELELENDKEEEWPDKYTMRKCQGLLIVGRDITTIPDEVLTTAAESKVHIVDLAKNKLATIPPSISMLSDTLTQLVLTTNNLKSVPIEIGECVHLQYLELSKNCLNDLPSEFGNLKNLREIVISNNRFPKIPRCIYDMVNLEILLAAENQISEINVSSDALAKLKRLTVLDLRNNSIISVPPELGNFRQLRSLELTGNCFRQPRQAILEKGTETVLSYLRDRIPVE